MEVKEIKFWSQRDEREGNKGEASLRPVVRLQPALNVYRKF